MKVEYAVEMRFPEGNWFRIGRFLAYPTDDQISTQAENAAPLRSRDDPPPELIRIVKVTYEPGEPFPFRGKPPPPSSEKEGPR